LIVLFAYLTDTTTVHNLKGNTTMNTPNKHTKKTEFDALSFWLVAIPTLIALAIIATSVTVSGGGF
jgi:hypothetical protein